MEIGKVVEVIFNEEEHFPAGGGRGELFFKRVDLQREKVVIGSRDRADDKPISLKFDKLNAVFDNIDLFILKKEVKNNNTIANRLWRKKGLGDDGQKESYYIGLAKELHRRLNDEDGELDRNLNIGQRELRRRLVKKGKPKGKKTAPKRTAEGETFIRDQQVRAYVHLRSDFTCDFPGCSWKGFKKADGIWYIEVHHLVPLAEDGPDTIYNAASFCPNCHRALHYSSEKAELTRKVVVELNRKYPNDFPIKTLLDLGLLQR